MYINFYLIFQACDHIKHNVCLWQIMMKNLNENLCKEKGYDKKSEWILFREKPLFNFMGYTSWIFYAHIFFFHFDSIN